MRTLLAATALAVALTPAAALAADSCPNAALRTGKQAQLPDCRAWEQVTPAEKNGNPVVASDAVLSDTLGDRLFTFGSGSIVPTESGPQRRAFLSARGAGGWTTRPTDPPQPGSTATVATGLETFLVSDDGTKALVVTPYVLAPGGVEDNSNLYLRDLTQPNAYSLVASLPGLAFFSNATSSPTYAFLDATPDLSTVLVAGSTEIQTDVPQPSTPYLYALSGGRITLVSRLPGETAPVSGNIGGTGPATERNHISDDGRTVTWQADGEPARWFRTTLGGRTVELSRRRTAVPDPVTASGGAFSSADGFEATFGYQGALTDDSTVGSSAIYRADGDDLVDLTAPFTRGGVGQAFNIQAVSSDRRLVWFSANTLSGRADDPVDPPGVPGYALFVIDVERGTIHRVARFDTSADSLALTGYRFSPDGRRVAFRSSTPLTGVSAANPSCSGAIDGSVEGYCPQVFTWDARRPDDPVVCASCAAGRAPQPATFGTTLFGLPTRGNRAITNDGRVFFDTAQQLVRSDTDTSADVYQFTPGVGAQLVSGGGTGADAMFGDISADGSSVFFATQQQLVEQDADTLADVYVARTDGGIAAQRVAPPAADVPACAGVCRPEPAAQPARPAQGSREVATPATVEPPRFSVDKPTAKALRTAARRGRLAVAVKVTAPGTLAASLRRKSRTVASATRRATKAQTVTLTLRLSKRARRELRRSGKLSVQLTVRYSERLTPYRTTLTIKKGGAR